MSKVIVSNSLFSNQNPDIKVSGSLDSDGNFIQNVNATDSIVPSSYDYVSLSYTGNNPTTIVYKTGGASGTTVATLTIAYSGNNITSVTKT